MNDKKSDKIVLIDGNSLIYRAFFALPTTLALPSGQVTNAVYGFTSMLIRLLIDEKPDIVAVAFDTKAPTFRHEQYELYKAHREETPGELISQFPLVKEVLSAMAIPVLEMDGYEADDLLATLARRSEKKGHRVVVVTGDRDAFQLIDEKTRVMTTRKGITDIVVYDRDKVIERYGVTPAQIPDFLGLKGDASDNIPGVPGIGDKTAAKLVQAFDNIENLLENIDAVSPERLKSNLAEHREDAILSKKLATLHFDVPIDIKLEDFPLGRWDEAEIRQVFSGLMFKTLLERFLENLHPGQQAEKSLPPLPADLIFVDSTDDLIGEVSASDPKTPRGWNFASVNEGSETAVVAVAGRVQARVRVIVATLSGQDLTRLSARLKDLAENNNRLEAIFSLKDIISRLRNRSFPFGLFNFDPALAAYLLEATAGDYSGAALCAKYLGAALPKTENLPETAGFEAAAALMLAEKLEPELKRDGLYPLFIDVEMPLEVTLARMEEVGVGLDLDYLASFSNELETDINRLEEEIIDAAGEEFNVNSPQQLGKILFDKMGLQPVKKTKTKAAFATDISVLTKLKDSHPIVQSIIDYRELAKLKSTYVDALPPLINRTTKRVHTSFNQTVTATGRLSSSNPNLQNIPIRTEIGRRIRRAFIPAHRDEKLLVADYSQIELRLLAHLSADPILIKMFKEGADFHQATAAEVFQSDPDQVTGELRRRAKAINFGIIYGISPFGLSQQLDIDTEEAKGYIDRYFERFPTVKKFLDASIEKGYKDGFVTTILGRRRFLPELKSTNYQVRSFGERVATNFPLQGGAADIIKKAMINIDRRLIGEGWQTRMVLQVHDELIFEVPPLEEQAAFSMVKNEMEQAYPLTAPLQVDLAFGRNWGEAK